MSLLCALALFAGCDLRHNTAPPLLGAGGVSDSLAPGVVHRAIPTSAGEGIDLIDIDLARTPARIVIGAENIQLTDGLVTARSFTPHEWLDRTHALAATNGGYFGMEVGSDRKEIVGLFVQNGRVRHAAPPLHGKGSANIRAGRYARSAFGITNDGHPEIAWAATDPASPQTIRRYPSPTGVTASRSSWKIAMIAGCGPTLIHDGKVFVTDRQERLVSPGPKARTFVAYDGPPGAPRHFVLGMASGMTYADLAAFLMSYFPRYDKTRTAAAMCLDGGASTQLSYRLHNGTVQSPRETGVTVPDAILVLPK